MQVYRTEGGAQIEEQARIQPKPVGAGALLAGLASFSRKKPLGAAGAVVIILIITIGVLGRWADVTPHDPKAIGLGAKFMGPGGDLFLGTDQLGRDTVSRLMFGAWISMKVAVVSVLVGITSGTLIGVFSAYSGGKADLIIQRVVDALMGFPPIILALGLMAALGASDRNVIIALTAIFIPGATRVIRSQALSIKELDYMLAARAIGATSGRIVLRHMLPNVAATYIVLVTVSVGFAIVVEASLSFLGVGIPPDVPTWGGMLQIGRQYIDTQAWLDIPPMIAIGLVVFSVNFLGDALRDVLDPKLRGR